MNLPREVFEFRAFTRLKQIEYLMKTGQIDDRFFWREGVNADRSGGRQTAPRGQGG